MEKKYDLSVVQRATLMQIIPQEGDYITFRIIRDLKSQIGFSEKDIKDFEIKHENKLMTWNADKQKNKIVPIGEKGQEIIIEALKRLNDEKKINESNVSLYELFITEK